MKIKNLIKAIFFVSTLINSFPSGKATQLLSNDSKVFSQLKNNNWVNKVFPKHINVASHRLPQKYRNFYKSNSKYQVLPTYKYESSLLLANSPDIKNELEIQSEIQSEENNILNAKGNVLVFYRGNILKADSLIYDKTEKTVSAKGNISLNIGDQLFKMSSFQYDFNSKKGYLFDVKGLIKTDNLINDLLSNFETSDTTNTKLLKEIKKDKVLNTFNKIDHWIFFTDKIVVNGNKWTSDKAIFTNDLLELKQVKIQVNSLEAISSKEELRMTSSLNYLILEEKLTIPFWLRERTITKSGESFGFLSRWNLGFDNLDRDGYFISRKFNTINLFNDFVLELEPQYLFQRSLKGYTKSFVNKGDSITGNKVKRDTTFLDYFALNSIVKGKINAWDLEIDGQMYSFDSKKFSDALRIKATLSKEITFLQSKWKKSFYGVYRDRIWNGSIGEAEIYTGYGSKFEKQNTWNVNGIKKTESLSLGLANIEAEALNSKNLVTSYKGNFFYSLSQKFPIIVDKPQNNLIDKSFKFISKPIQKGIYLNTELAAFYTMYENGNHQEYIGFGAGPEFIFGEFKKNAFDYTRISLFPFYRMRSGNSIFKFDQISDEFTLDLAFDQQLYGPIILQTQASLNLDNNSKDYGDFINSKISLSWKKRSYEVGLFYSPQSESAGIKFTLFGFK